MQGALGRDLGAARLRLAVLGLLIAAYWFGLATAFDFPRVLSPEWLSAVGFPINVLSDFATSFFAPQVIQHILPLFGGLFLALRFGSHYLADLHELQSFALARRYLLGAAFGLGLETLEIADGDLTNLDHGNPLLRVGGPGHMSIHLGFAAVMEDSQGLPVVYGPQSRRFVAGFERLRDVVDLRDQLRQVPEVRATTADGVAIRARDVQMVFRVYGGGQTRSLETPYPYTDKAVRQLVYGQPVLDRGPRRWTEGLDRLVADQVETFVSSLSFENLLALRPEGSQRRSAPEIFHISRRKLTERFHTSETERRLREQGLELIWAGVGTWEVDNEGADVHAGRALMEAWKIRQRLDLLEMPSYQQRQRARGRREAILAPIRDSIKTWESMEGDRGQRAWSIIAAIRKALQQATADAQGSGSGEGKNKAAAAMTYLADLPRPLTERSDSA